MNGKQETPSTSNLLENAKLIYELIYTSARRGLKGGSHGFCTVAATEGIPRAVATKLESLSGYRHAFEPRRSGASKNPVLASHVVISVAGKRYHVLSRIVDAGVDYSQRSNKLAHHVAIDECEALSAHPAWLLGQPGLFVDEWNEEPRELPPRTSVRQGTSQPRVCQAWKALTGDAGWGGVLASAAAESAGRPAVIVFPSGTNCLELASESLGLLSPALRWEVTLSTYFSRVPPDIACLWRFVLAGSPTVAEVRRNRNVRVIDLTSSLGSPPDSVFVQAAREGTLVRVMSRSDAAAFVAGEDESRVSGAGGAGNIALAPLDSSLEHRPRRGSASETAGTIGGRWPTAKKSRWPLTTVAITLSCLCLLGLGITARFVLAPEVPEPVAKPDETASLFLELEQARQAAGDACSKAEKEADNSDGQLDLAEKKLANQQDEVDALSEEVSQCDRDSRANGTTDEHLQERLDDLRRRIRQIDEELKGVSEVTGRIRKSLQDVKTVTAEAAKSIETHGAVLGNLARAGASGSALLFARTQADSFAGKYSSLEKKHATMTTTAASIEQGSKTTRGELRELLTRIEECPDPGRPKKDDKPTEHVDPFRDLADTVDLPLRGAEALRQSALFEIGKLGEAANQQLEIDLDGLEYFTKRFTVKRQTANDGTWLVEFHGKWETLPVAELRRKDSKLLFRWYRDQQTGEEQLKNCRLLLHSGKFEKRIYLREVPIEVLPRTFANEPNKVRLWLTGVPDSGRLVFTLSAHRRSFPQFREQRPWTEEIGVMELKDGGTPLNRGTLIELSGDYEKPRTVGPGSIAGRPWDKKIYLRVAMHRDSSLESSQEGIVLRLDTVLGNREAQEKVEETLVNIQREQEEIAKIDLKLKSIQEKRKPMAEGWQAKNEDIRKRRENRKSALQERAIEKLEGQRDELQEKIKELDDEKNKLEEVKNGLRAKVDFLKRLQADTIISGDFTWFGPEGGAHLDVMKIATAAQVGH